MKRPIAAFGLCFFAFQILSVYVEITTLLTFAFFGSALFAVITFFTAKSKSKLKSTAGICLLACFSAVLCMFFHTEMRIKPLENLHGETAEFTATVYEVTSSFNADSFNVHLIVKGVNGENIAINQTFSAKAMLPGVSVGDVLTFDGTFNKIADEEKQYNFTKGKFVEIIDITGIEFTGKSNDIWYFAHLIQRRFAQNIIQHTHGELGGVVATMAVGDSAFLSEDLEQNFTKAGLSHVLVVSGMHIGIFAGVMHFIANSFLKSRLAAIFAALMSFGFVFVTGFTSSSSRALVIIFLFYGAKVLCRKSDIFTSLAVAAVLACMLNPYAAVDLGTLLSFSATFGVILSAVFLQRNRAREDALRRGKVAQNYGGLAVESEQNSAKAHYIAQEQNGKAEQAQPNYQDNNNYKDEYEDGSSNNIIALIQNIFAVPVAATLATMPVLIAFGLSVSVFGVFANVITAPFVPFVTIGGVVLAVLAEIALFQPVAMLFGLCAVACARLVTAVATAFASLPFAAVYITGLPAALCIFGAVVLCFVGYRQKFAYSKIFAGAALFIIMCGSFYIYVDKDIVRVVRAGSATETAVVIMRGFETAVIFAGRSTNSAHVNDVLLRFNRDSVDVVIDLRTTPNAETLSAELNAKEVVAAEELTNSITIDVFNDLYISLNHQANGNCALLHVGETTVGITHGSVDMAAYENEDCDIFIAGVGEAENLTAPKIWLAQDAGSWVLNYKKSANFYEDFEMLLLSAKTGEMKWGAKPIDYE